MINKKYLFLLIITLAIIDTYLLISLFNSKRNLVVLVPENISDNVKVEDPSVVYVSDPSIMTEEERDYFRLDKSLKVEVVTRSATGTPLVYKLLR
jgi:hypothetical protein